MMRSILTTPRSGSTYLGNLLRRNSEVDVTGELFAHWNKQYVEYSRRSGPKALREFFQRSYPGEVVVPKIFVWQFSFLNSWTDFFDIFSGRSIFLRRRDVIAQAVSRYIADETGQWLVKRGEGTPREPEGVSYNFLKIDARVRRLEYQNALLERILDVSRANFMCCYYEELVSQPVDTLDQICLFLELRRDSAWREGQSERQFSTLNRDFSRRYREDFLREMKQYPFHPEE